MREAHSNYRYNFSSEFADNFDKINQKTEFTFTEEQKCLHEQCSNCHGTGFGIMGICVHSISCPCPKCSPRR